MGRRELDGLALGIAAAGGLLAYAGVRGYSVPHAIQALVSGQPPSTGGQANPITTPAAPSSLVNAGNPPPIPGPGGRYSSGQLQSLWILAGGDPAKAATAACIAIHESNGEPAVTSSNPDGGTNVGLWQLDTPGGKGAGHSVTELQDPLTNARVAVTGSSDGTDWSAWATHAQCGV